MRKGEALIYKINQLDQIVEFDGVWDQTAESSNSQELLSQKVLGRSLWDFIDLDITPFYKEILKNVRETKKDFQMPYRCDTPKRKQFMTLEILYEKNNLVTFKSTLNRSEDYRHDEFYFQRRIGKETHVIVCSMCNKVHFSKKWQELSQALKDGLLQEDIFYCRINAICEECKSDIQKMIEKFRPAS